MTEPLRLSARVVIPEHELLWRFSRSGGAGGQHVNTSSTRVELVFDVVHSEAFGSVLRARAIERLQSRLVDGCVVVVSSERRSQMQNRLAARDKLREVMTAALAPPQRARRPTKPTRSSQVNRVATKRKRSEVKRGRGRPTTDD